MGRINYLFVEKRVSRTAYTAQIALTLSRCAGISLVMTDFGKLLRSARLCARGGEGLSFGQFAKLTRYSTGSLADFENGRLVPPESWDILALCAVLKTDPKPMLRAAIEARGHVCMEVDAARIALAANLAFAWPSMTQATVDKIAKVFAEARHA